jgi:peroxiredoxin
MVLKDSILEDIVVFGNDAAKDYTDFKRKISHIKPPPEYYSYNKAYKNSLLANDTLTSNYFYRKKDSIEATIKDSYIGIVKNWINKKKTSLINSQIIRTYLFDNLTDLQIKKIFYSLPLQGRINSWGKEIEIYFSALSIGKNLPTFLLRDTSNITINLNSFKGSFVFLDFWASWCIPCREQSEKIMSVYNNYKGKGLKLICISLDKVADDWKKAILKDRLDCINVCDLQGFDGIAKLYMIKSIPANFLIDKQGKIIAKNIKIDELEKLLTSRIK